MNRLLVQRLLPALVSAAILAWVFRDVELEALIAAASWHSFAILVPAFALYGAATLWLEAISLDRLLKSKSDAKRPTLWTLARIKCASYLLAIVHYALGIGALTVLVARRTQLTLARAASVVVLISTADILIVLGIASLAATWLQAENTALQLPLFVAAVAIFAGGIALLRTPRSLGPLERVRKLALFEELRTQSIRRFGELVALRFAFSCCFIAICSTTLFAFGVSAPFAKLIFGVVMVAVISSLPIAVAGLGTSQAAFLFFFADDAPRETLLAMSLALSIGMITLRGMMGLVFAREFTQEALRDARTTAP